ncbi:MAG: DUF2155 domain-containing protein [Hydrotalea sp.]|nr:DUF2155 domain-containing protein [Hydrotalea sp.]
MKRKIVTTCCWVVLACSPIAIGMGKPMLAMAQTDGGDNSADNNNGTPPATAGKTNNKAAKTATTRMLNKLTLELREEKMPVGTEKRFGKLKIKLFACYKNSNSDSVAFFQIWDGGAQRKKPGETTESVAVKNANGETRVFSGWMFSSSPALNPLDHAIYDVWLIGCD